MPADWTVNSIADATGLDRRTVKSRLSDVPVDEVGGTEKKPINFYHLNTWGPVIFGNGEVGSDDMSELKKKNEYELLRQRRRENDEQEGLLVSKQVMIGKFAQWAKIVGNDLDSLPASLSDCSRECERCGSATKLDGRGVERVGDVITRFKNSLARLHDRLAD